MAESEAQNERTGDHRFAFGCGLAMLIVNTLLLGLLASSFSQGPYSSRGQEVWYRYGSIGFLLAGAVLPGAALLLGGRRSLIVSIVLTIWMLAALIAALMYATMSSGGV